MRDLVFERSDGSSVLISIRNDGHVTMAEKLPGGGAWGEPRSPVIDDHYGALDSPSAVTLLRELVSAEIIDLDAWEEDMPEFVAQIRKAVQG